VIVSIIEQAMIALPLLCGAYITLSLLKLPDFSIESAYLLGAVTAYLASDLPLPLVIGCSVLGGVSVGFIVTFFNQYLRIPYLLAAIVTNGLVHGMTLYLLKGSVNGFHLATAMSEVSLLMIISFVVVILMIVLLRSQMGFCLAIYGNNPQFFDHHTMSRRFVLFFGIAFGHALAGVSGFLFSLTSGIVDVTMNFGIIMLCLTSLMIGKFLQRGRRPNVLIPVIGITVYFLIQQLLLNAGVNLKFFNAFQALIVLFILFMGNRKETYTMDHLGV
jgi:putative ABC transport system permease protein